MTIEPLREVHQARPFQPFTLHLADGRAAKSPSRSAMAPKQR